MISRTITHDKKKLAKNLGKNLGTDLLRKLRQADTAMNHTAEEGAANRVVMNLTAAEGSPSGCNDAV